MNCRQCGKKTEQLCARSDCWATKTNIALERRRVRREVAKELRNDENLAVRAFPDNFHKVASWAQANGSMRPSDKDAIRKMASETVYAVMTYAAIARSL